MRFITPIIHFLKKYLPSHRYFITGLIFCTSYTFAADTTKDSDVIEAIVQVLNLLFTVITFLLTPAVILAGWLLSPDWTMGDFFGLRPYFIQVWVLVSNLVYIIFALMLLWMAVVQIFSGESDYAFKKKLPRFLVGIMIVPFTWLIVSWTLSFANQAVAAVLSIPSGAIAQMQTDTEGGVFHLQTIPTKFVLNFAEDAPGANPESNGCGNNGTTSDGTKCISPAEFIANNESGPFFIILIYAYDIFKIQKTEMVDFASVCGGVEGANVDTRTCISDLGKLLRKFGVAFITTTFFAIILIALCWVLLARAFKLWIYVMFSPLFGLAYAVSEGGMGEALNSEGGGGGSHGGGSIGKLGFKAFFSLAMVPVLVSAVLSFGILFIGVVNNTFTTGTLADTGGGTFCTTGEFMVKYCIEQNGGEEGGYSSRIIIGGDGSEGGGEYAITFEFGSMLSEFVGSSAGNTLSGGAEGFADGAKDIFAHIILSLIALAVMWMGVKAAVSTDEITKMAFDPFAKFGASVGNFVQHIPSYLPTPHPAFAAFNPAMYDALAKKMDTNVLETQNYKQKDLEALLDPQSRAFSGTVNDFNNGVKSFSEVADRLNSEEVSRNPKETAKILADGLKKAQLTGPDEAKKIKLIADLEGISRSPEGLKRFQELVSENSDVITAADTKVGGIKKYADKVATSSSTSAADTFAGHTIDIGAGIIGGNPLSPGQQIAVKKEFVDIETINNLTASQIKAKLKNLKFPETQIKNIPETDDSTARKVATDLFNK